VLNFTGGGVPFGHLIEGCLLPMKHLYVVTMYYYFPRVMERSDLYSQHGIEASLFQEVVIV